MIQASPFWKANKEIDFIFKEVDSKDGSDRDGLLSFTELMENHKYLTSDEEFLAPFDIDQKEKAEGRSIDPSMIGTDERAAQKDDEDDEGKDEDEKVDHEIYNDDDEDQDKDQSHDKEEKDNFEFLSQKNENTSAISKFIRKWKIFVFVTIENFEFRRQIIN